MRPAGDMAQTPFRALEGIFEKGRDPLVCECHGIAGPGVPAGRFPLAANLDGKTQSGFGLKSRKIFQRHQLGFEEFEKRLGFLIIPQLQEAG